MPKAKKLPSGAWQTYVYSHTENGKRKYISFTAGTKAEAELKAAEYKANKKRQRYVDITVGEAIDRYIESKSGILSPSTLREYLRSAEHDLDELRPKKIKNLTSEDLQLFVTHLTIDGKSEKTIIGSVYRPKRFHALCRRLTKPYKPFSITLKGICTKRSCWESEVCAVVKSAP